MSSLFNVRTVLVTTQDDLVRLGIEAASLKTEVIRTSHRYSGQRGSGVQYQRCGGGRRVIRKKVGN